MTNTPHTTIRTGSNIPAYFLGRPRDLYLAAMASTRQTPTNANFVRAA